MQSYNINFQIPTGWPELSDKQLRFVYSLIAQDFDTAEVQTLCLLQWGGAKVVGRQDSGSYLLKMGDVHFEVTPLTIAELLPHLDWLGAMPTAPVRPRLMNRREALPADFGGVPFETFIVCDNYLQGYLATNEDSLLDELGRVLYQDKKLHFQSWQRVAVFYWMVSLKDYLARTYSEFFQPAASDSENLLGSGVRADVQESMNAQIRALTKGDITKESEVLALDTHRALTELNAQAREYRQLNAQLKK